MRTSSLFVAGLAVVIASTAPASAQSNNSNKKQAAWERYEQGSLAAWNALTTYAECRELVKRRGWSDWEGWYGCNARNFKN
jgi:hypothetical protein